MSCPTQSLFTRPKPNARATAHASQTFSIITRLLTLRRRDPRAIDTNTNTDDIRVPHRRRCYTQSLRILLRQHRPQHAHKCRMQLHQLFDGRLRGLARLPPQLLCGPGSAFPLRSNGVRVVIVEIALLVIVICVVIEFEVLEIELRTC